VFVLTWVDDVGLLSLAAGRGDAFGACCKGFV